MANKGRSESRTNRSNLMSHDSSPRPTPRITDSSRLWLASQLQRRARTACHYCATDILSLPAMRLISESTNRLSCSQKPRPPHKMVKSLWGSQKPHLTHKTNKSLSMHNSNDSKTQISSVSDSNKLESKEWSFPSLKCSCADVVVASNGHKCFGKCFYKFHLSILFSRLVS